MAEKISERIVKSGRLMMILFLALTVGCVFMIDNVNINYDITEYLSEDTMTRRSLEIMNAEFGASEQLGIMFEDLEEGAAARVCAELADMHGVISAVYDAEHDKKTQNGVVYERVTLLIDSAEPLAFVGDLQAALAAREDVGAFTLTGFSAQMREIQENIAVEIPIAMGIAVLVVILVLFLTSHAYIEPFLFSLVLLSSIIINMGTNWIFGTISFITFAVAAILQLALAMDYSIMLLHNFTELREEGLDDRTAVIKALARSIMPISSSSLTTVAGLGALMFMSFTIGFDIGMVLSKGIIISMLTVFLLMPALILAFGKKLRTTAHKPIKLGGQHIGTFAIKTRRVLPAVLIAVILLSAYLQTLNEYTFTDAGTSADAKHVESVFPETNMLVILIPACETDADYDAQREFVSKLQALEHEGRGAISGVISMVTTGAQAIEYYTPDDIADMTNLNVALVRALFNIMRLGERERGDRIFESAYQYMNSDEFLALRRALEAPEDSDNTWLTALLSSSGGMDLNALSAQITRLKTQLDEAFNTFNGENYSRLMVMLDFSNAGDDLNALVKQVIDLHARAYGGEGGITGSAMSIYDISSAFRKDLTRVSLITIAAILIIIMLSFGSLTVPVILVCVIQGAIWITMAISRVRGQSIFFMCYLICTAVQMGATIDYGILLASHYRRLRAALTREQAMREALKLSLPTILTSGIILIVAGYSIGRVCSVYYISSIGLLLSRGAAISVSLVLILLPQLLLVMDKAVMRGLPSVDADAERHGEV